MKRPKIENYKFDGSKHHERNYRKALEKYADWKELKVGWKVDKASLKAITAMYYQSQQQIKELEELVEKAYKDGYHKGANSDFNFPEMAWNKWKSINKH